MRVSEKSSALLTLVGVALTLASSATAQTIVSVTNFAAGTAVNSTSPDSICSDGAFVWVSWGNNSVSAGGGFSTVVQYNLRGQIIHLYSIAGSVDGLKADPSGMIWALQNQDGNSTLTLIDPVSGIVPGSPFPYAIQSTTQGYDDVAFLNGKAFVSRTNPAAPTDAVLQYINAVASPIIVTDVLVEGATGTNIATGAANQALPDSDPDSLKITPGGELMLTSGDNGSLIFVKNPTAPSPAVAFLQLIDSTGATVSGLDDCVFATKAAGTFLVSDTKNNRVIAIKMTGLTVGSLYGSVGSLNAFTSVDEKTGLVTPVVGSLNGPHGVLFLSK